MKNKEIERKYLVTSDRYKELAEKSYHIIQGYLSHNKECVVRIRLKDEDAYITVKGKNTGFTRAEFEYPVPLQDAKEMLQLCHGGIIDKIRYTVRYKGKLWEVDEFQGSLKGLKLAEIELETEKEEFEIPDFIGKEVSDDPCYYNSNLSKMRIVD